MTTIFSILINPVTVSVLVLCALCLTGLNVLLSMLIACIIGGVAGGIPLLSAPEGTQTVMQLLTSGFASNATTALAYILLGTFATCISTTGLAEILSKKLSRLLGGHRLALIGVLTLVACLSQNLIPVHIAGLFANIAAEGRLAATVKMFASLYGIIIVLQLLYILSQFVLASGVCRKNHLKSIKNIAPAYFTALGTQSSASTIPVALNCAYSNNVNRDVADFVVPLCATINLNGDTICLVLGSMGIMIASGMNPTLAVFAPFILMLGVTMVAAPGVPGGGVMAALGLITSMLGFTDPMQQLIIALHFSQDSFGTAANVTGDQALALIVDEVDRKTGKAEIEERRQHGNSA